jgi:type III secretory pathway component EscS
MFTSWVGVAISLLQTSTNILNRQDQLSALGFCVLKDIAFFITLDIITGRKTGGIIKLSMAKVKTSSK